MTEHVHECVWVVEKSDRVYASCISYPKCKAMLNDEEIESRLNATERLGAVDAKEAKNMAYDINNIPLGNTLNAYADTLEGK